MELRDSGLTSMVDPLPSNQTTKLLESISQKDLADTPAQLQHMPLCLQGYDYIICYDPGKEMALPDALSCFSPCPGPDIPLDIAIHHAHLSTEWKEAFQHAFVSDSEMHAHADLIITSWLDDIREVLTPYTPTGNIVRPSLSKMALSFMEKPLLFLLEKGREYYINYTSSMKESPNPSCSCVDVSSGLLSTKPLKKLFANVRPAPGSKPKMLQHPPTPTPSHP